MKRKSPRETSLHHSPPKSSFQVYLSLVFLSSLLALMAVLPFSDTYATTELAIKRPLTQVLGYSLPTPAPYPNKINGLIAPQLGAQGVIVVDIDSQKVLFEKNSNQRLFPASTTKLLTGLVALEYYRPETVLTVRRENVEGSSLGLKMGEQMTVLDLLKATLMPSANDAALVFADNYPGGEFAFVAKMNQKAKELHLEESQFKNPTGLQDPDHYSSARDLARLASVVIKNPLIKQIVGTRQTQIFDITKNQEITIENLNKLLGINGIDGLKTGSTPEAGGCLVATSNKNGHRLVSVVLNSKDRFLDTQSLLTFVWGSYRW